MDAYTQQWLTIEAVTAARVDKDDVWMNYVSMGGLCDDIYVSAYLHGLVPLQSLQRDLVSHAVNELLDDSASPTDRAPYSDLEVALASGYADSGHEGYSESALAKLIAAGNSLLGPKEYEARRIDSLGRTRLMDTPAEERFDRITRLARARFGVSTGSIALIGRDRQFIKSVNGPISANGPRESAFCNQTIRFGGLLIVSDALQDARFRTNPLVVEPPHIRFYAGYPLTGPGGWRIGSLCVIDDQPRRFTEDDERDLRVLAELAQREINGLSPVSR